MNETNTTCSIALPGHGCCYICGPDNAAGLGVTFHLDGDCVRTAFTLDTRQQGAPGIAHGGCLSAVLDEAMVALIWAKGHRVLAARLEVDFRAAVPLGIRHSVQARIATIEGRKIWGESEIRNPDGTVVCQARGLFIKTTKVTAPELYSPAS